MITLRSILPTGVSGTLSTMRTSRGYLYLPRRSRENSISSSGVASVPGCELHERDDFFSTKLVGFADDTGNRHRRMLDEHVLDVARKHVEAASQDQVLLSIDDVEVTLLVEASHVAGEEPAVLEAFRPWCPASSSSPA